MANRAISTYFHFQTWPFQIASFWTICSLSNSKFSKSIANCWTSLTFVTEREKRFGEGTNDATNNLNYTKMLFEMDHLHPRIKELDEETQELKMRKRPYCGTKTGWPDCCKRKNRESELSEYGVGSVLYFQFLKFMSCMFILMLILASPAMFFFIQGQGLEDSSFTSFVKATSLGNLGSSSPVCQTARYDLSNADDPNAYLTLSCNFGELWAIKTFGQVSVSNEIDCDAATSSADATEYNYNFFPPSCNYLEFDDAYQASFDRIFESQCKGKQTCQFNFNQGQLPESQCNLVTARPSNWQFVMVA